MDKAAKGRTKLSYGEDSYREPYFDCERAEILRTVPGSQKTKVAAELYAKYQEQQEEKRRNKLLKYLARIGKTEEQWEEAKRKRREGASK